MPVRYQIKDTDTVEYLALTYLGDATRWRDIVDYNNLVYPYISPDSTDKMNVYASGYLHVTRDVATQPITIESGWTVKTKTNIMSSVVKTYTVVNDVFMDVGVTDVYLYIRSIVPGIQGNTPQDNITELGDEFNQNSIDVTITNESAIINGVEGFIRTTGEYVFIPDDEDVVALQDSGSIFDYNEMNYFYGTDLAMELDDLTVDEHAGDLATVSYINNIVQSINRRFTTEKGDVLSDFTFGNGIIDIIGDNSLPLDARKSLIQVEIIEALNFEDRVSDPVINSITIVPEEFACYVDISMTVVKLGTSITFDSMRLGGIF